MTDLSHQLDRSIVIDATPETVFQFLSESESWARWWGAGSRITPTPGGEVYIRHPNGIEVCGEVLAVEPGRRIVFTYGFASGTPIPVGVSRVEIALAPEGRSTRLHLRHRFADERVRDEHVQGWRYQLSVLSNAVADRLHADAAARADAWFDAWAETDEDVRRRRLETIATPDVTVRDRFSRLEGIDDLMAHIGASLRFMPGVRLSRTGEVRQCQGTALVDWEAKVGDQPRGRGTTVFTFDADGLISAVTGFWQT